MGPLEAFLRSIPEHDQQRKKVSAVSKEKRKNAASPTHSINSTLTPTLWRPPIAPPLSDMADLTLQPSTSSGNHKINCILSKQMIQLGNVHNNASFIQN